MIVPAPASTAVSFVVYRRLGQAGAPPFLGGVVRTDVLSVYPISIVEHQGVTWFVQQLLCLAESDCNCLVDVLVVSVVVCYVNVIATIAPRYDSVVSGIRP